MWKEYKETFDGVHASQRLKTEVMNMKREESFTKKRRIPAAALVAAILVIALAGTALAGVFDYLNLQVFSNAEDSGYTVTGSPMTKYPLSAFSPALLEASEARNGLAVVDILFDTWAEVREFVGLDIPCVWPDIRGDWTESYRVYLFHTGPDPESEHLWGVAITGTQRADCILSEIIVQIRTEYWQGDNAEITMRDSGTDGIFSQLDRYLMANGTTAEVVQYAGSEEYPHAFCEGYFMRNGILYDVASYGTASTLEETISRLYAILDAYK